MSGPTDQVSTYTSVSACNFKPSCIAELFRSAMHQLVNSSIDCVELNMHQLVTLALPTLNNIADLSTDRLITDGTLDLSEQRCRKKRSLLLIQGDKLQALKAEVEQRFAFNI